MNQIAAAHDGAMTMAEHVRMRSPLPQSRPAAWRRASAFPRSMSELPIELFRPRCLEAVAPVRSCRPPSRNCCASTFFNRCILVATFPGDSPTMSLVDCASRLFQIQQHHLAIERPQPVNQSEQPIDARRSSTSRSRLGLRIRDSRSSRPTSCGWRRLRRMQIDVAVL